MIKESNSAKAFNIFNVLLLLFLTVLTAYPILYVVFASVSNPSDLMAHQGVLLHPLGFTTEAYQMVFTNKRILTGYLNTLFVLVVGVSLNLILTMFGAYFLALKDVFWKKYIMFFIIFTMYFSGGLIPFYLTVKQMHLDNSLWALIIPTAINTTNLIIMRTAFAGVPDSLIESARIDGAHHFRILFSIMFPLALPTVAVIVLYYGVGHWNAWFHASIFIRERSKFPLQLILREILLSSNTESMMGSGVSTDNTQMVSELIKYAVIVVSSAPILCLYPFLQKYFVKGVMIGAVKG